MITKSLKPLIFTILVLSILLVITQQFQDELVFDRFKIDHGQWWLIASGNFVHSNYPHLLMNIAGLWILGLLFIDSLSHITFILSVIFLGIFIGLGLYYLNPELQKYYGISGAIYGLFIIGATVATLSKDYLTGIAVALLIITKIIWDLIYGGSTASEELIGTPVAVDAHFYGAIGAIIISIVLYLIHRKRPLKHTP